MKRKRISLILIFILGTIFFAYLSNASVEVYEQNIQKSYLEGDVIQGSIGIKISGEPAQSIFASNFPGKISLLEILRKNDMNEGVDYNCSVSGCGENYIDGGVINKLSAKTSEEKFFGFKLNGKDLSILSAKVSLRSNISASCTRQLLVDVLDKNESYLQNRNYTMNSCGVINRGCFDSSLSNYEEVIITSSPATTKKYCERISLPPAPAYKLGANITNSTIGYWPLKMEIYNSKKELLDSCILPKNNRSSELLFCIVNSSNIYKEDYFVCISASDGSSLTTNYKIRSEQEGEICGTSDISADSFSRDYEISAEPMQFGDLILDINETSIKDFALTDYIDNYILERYNRNCVNGCIIPFRIISELEQEINFNNVAIQYDSGGDILLNNQLFMLTRQPSFVNTYNLTLELKHANFSIPLKSKEKALQLYFNGVELFSPPLPLSIISSFAFDVTPKNALVGINTLFTIYSAENISSIYWDFGDGITTKTNTKSVMHRYLEEKNYTLEIEVTNSSNMKVKKKFNVAVGNSSFAAKLLITDAKSSINNLSEQTKSYPDWIRSSIENIINISNLNDSVNSLENQMANATGNEDYNKIVSSIINIEIPERIASIKSGTLPLALGYGKINSEYIAVFSGADNLTSAELERVKMQIINWTETNYDVKVYFQVISKFLKNEPETLLTAYKVQITSKNDGKESYFVIPYPREAITFKQNYNEKDIILESNSGTIIPIKGTEVVEFSLAEEIEISDLGAYLSPNANIFIPSGGKELPIEDGKSRITFYAYIILICLAFILYIALQEWYKRHYESYLFKNTNDLYNLIYFVNNARLTQLDDETIKNKLSSMGWSSEQTRYIFKKLDNKRTGMFEIPLFRFLEKKKINSEISKRQQSGGDVRFIKRPYL